MRFLKMSILLFAAIGFTADLLANEGKRTARIERTYEVVSWGEAQSLTDNLWRVARAISSKGCDFSVYKIRYNALSNHCKDADKKFTEAGVKNGDDIYAGFIEWTDYVGETRIPGDHKIKFYLAARKRGNSSNELRLLLASLTKEELVNRMHENNEEKLKRELEAMDKDTLKAALINVNLETLKSGLECIDRPTLVAGLESVDLATLKAGLINVDKATLKVALENIGREKLKEALENIDEDTLKVAMTVIDEDTYEVGLSVVDDATKKLMQKHRPN